MVFGAVRIAAPYAKNDHLNMAGRRRLLATGTVMAFRKHKTLSGHATTNQNHLAYTVDCNYKLKVID